MITRRLARPLGQISSSPSWTCPACRARPSLLQSTQKPHSQPRRTYAYGAPSAGHQVPKLHHDDFFAAYGIGADANGKGGLYSPRAYKVAWTDYQKGLIDKLNELVSGTDLENIQPKDLTLMLARDPLNAAIFNHASAAFNNNMFFNTLSPKPSKLHEQLLLQDSLIRTFGSVETLKATMLDTAATMFGPGYVWLVWARNIDPRGSAISSNGGTWRVLTTYLAGTPYPEAGFRQQGVDMNNQNPNSYNNYLSQQSQLTNNTAGAFGAYSYSGKAEAKIPPGGTSVHPVLCVSTWQHAYMPDFGVNGKRQYLNNWWNVIDWGAVEANVPTEAKSKQAFAGGFKR